MTLYEKNIQELKSKYPIIYDAIKSVGTEDVSDIAQKPLKCRMKQY